MHNARHICISMHICLLIVCMIASHIDWLLQVREYLEKHYEEKSGMEAVKLAIKALTETVEAGSKNIEV